MVDNGQDMGQAHLALLGHLQTANLVVAGDPDSGIESYRGAQPDWLFGFRKLFGDHQTVVLSENRRIGKPLAPALGYLIRHNDELATHHPQPSGQAGHRVRVPGHTCRQSRRSSPSPGAAEPAHPGQGGVGGHGGAGLPAPIPADSSAAGPGAVRRSVPPRSGGPSAGAGAGGQMFPGSGPGVARGRPAPVFCPNCSPAP